MNYEFIERTIKKELYDSIAIVSYDEKTTFSHEQGDNDALLDEFNAFLNSADPGQYKIKVYHSKESKGVNARYDEKTTKILPFSVENSSVNGSDTNAGPIGSNPRIRELEDKLRTLELERMQRDFDDKLRRIEESQQTQTFEILKQLAEVVMSSKKQTVQSGITGSGQPQNTMGQQSETQRILQLLDRWQNADPEFYILLERIVQLAENDVQRYEIGKSFLKK